MAKLPTPYEPPFSFTGLDYFGPFYKKLGRGRATGKRYGAIFVCMNSQAIHLEVARSIETNDFIMVFTRKFGLIMEPISLGRTRNFVRPWRE